MREKEFRKLLDKFLDGSISAEENVILEEFTEDLISANTESQNMDDADKSHIKKSIWAGVSDKIDYRKKKARTWRFAAAAAALFMGLLTTGYLYVLNTQTVSPNLPPKNAITLELEDGSLKIIETDGSANVINKKGNIIGQQKGNQLVYSETGDVEELVFNTLTVPFGKTFEIQLSDGTKAHLNSGSSFKYPVKFLKGQERNVFITGEAFLDVAEDSLHPFIVSTDHLSVRVLDTKFNVSAYPEDETADVVLVEGSVSLYEASKKEDRDRNKVLLKPGFKGSFDKNNKRISKDSVITSMYTSWVNGELIFRNMTFENIIKKLERHYNVSISNNNKELTSKKFNANFGDETIDKVLNELKMNYGIDFEIKDSKTIIIK